jgi:hypothetical protein
MTDPQVSAPGGAPRRWPLFLAGVLLFLAGPILYVVQFSQGQLWMPWYVPVLATIGVLFMIASVWQRRGVLRSLGLVAFLLLCEMEWYLVLVATKTPAYTGPAQPGTKVPAFAATLADGTAFTNDDLEKGVDTVLVFFRGRW